MAGKGRGEAAPQGARLSERDRFWLRHHEACVASGETAKRYAKRRGLSVCALYQSRNRLRALGALAAAARQGRRVGAPERPAHPTFAKLGTFTPAAAARPRYRVRLANGASLEWEGPIVERELEALLPLLGRLA
jgi:hypothetical protein